MCTAALCNGATEVYIAGFLGIIIFSNFSSDNTKIGCGCDFGCGWKYTVVMEVIVHGISVVVVVCGWNCIRGCDFDIV